MRITFPPLDAKRMRAWRLNYTVTYVNEPHRKAFSTIVNETIKSLAFLQGIQCVISERHQFCDDEDYTVPGYDLHTTSDLVYFRSTQYSRMSRPEFRALLSQVFGGYPNVFSKNCPFEVMPQTIEALRKYPFPKSEPDFSVEFSSK